MSKPDSAVLDLEDRDPCSLNQEIQVSWDNLIGEPPLLKSPECAWSLSQYCFRFSRLGVYTCLSVLCAPIAACLTGTSYALFYFQYIWCTRPALWFCRANCGVIRSFVRACTIGCCTPIAIAFGYIFSQIRIKTVTNQEEGEKEEDGAILIL